MNFKNAPSFSLSKSLKKSITQMVPYNPAAPGPIYNVSGLGQREPTLSHSIGKSKRTEINHRIEETPSPLHYDPKHPTLTKNYSIPQSSFLQTLNLNPDPACYITDEKHTIRKVLAYTLSSRDPSIMDQTNKNPGPADYQSPSPLPILSRSKNIKQTSFGTGSRFRQEADQNPGAGHYPTNPIKLSQFQHRYSIGKAERHPSIECTPGPSDYPKASFVEQNVKSKLGKSLGERFKSSLLNEVTSTTINAFHKYHENPESLFAASKNSPKFSLGKEKRQFIRGNPNPGPAEYINDQFLAKHSSTALIPRSEHVEYSDTVFKPGPGTYRIEEEKGVTYSFPRSKSLATVATVAPGVGRYQLQSLKFEKGPAFSKSGRFGKADASVGVGQYNLGGSHENLVMEKALRSSMSKSSRFQNRQESTPGPGDYHIQSLINLKSQLEK